MGAGQLSNGSARPVGRRRRVLGVVLAVALLGGLGTALPPGASAQPADVCPSGWVPVPPPPRQVPELESLADVAAVGADDVWAVGEVSGRALAVHWDGTSWTRVPSPDPSAAAADHELLAVDGSGPTDVWATGHEGSAHYTQHWDGDGWTVVPMPLGAGVFDVASAGPGEAWLAGTVTAGDVPLPTTWRWSGTAWVAVPNAAPPGTYLNAIAASSPTNVWAVGTRYEPFPPTPVVQRWNGTSWSLVDLGGLPDHAHQGFEAVSTSGPGDVWVLGTLPAAATRPNYGLHWDGTAWTSASFPTRSGPSGPSYVHDVLALGSGDAIAVGELSGGPSGWSPVTLRWDGVAWEFEPEPVAVPDPRARLVAVDAGVGGERWAVGHAPLDTYAARRCDGPDGPLEDPVYRVAGPDRIGTAVAMSATRPAGSAGAAVLTRSDSFADALAGTPLAAAVDGPVLLTPPGQALDPRVLAELRRVLPAGGTVLVLGGPVAVAPAVDDGLRAAGFAVQRVQGPDRYATAVAIAGRLSHPPTQLLATGVDFADALAGGAAAAAIPGGAAILLTSGTTVPQPTADYLAAHPGTRYALGGPAAQALGSGATPIVGADRFATAARVAARFFADPATVVVASGRGFPDALSGGALAARFGVPVVLVEPTSLPAATDLYLALNRAALRSGVVAGGTTAVAETVLGATRRSLS